MAARKNLRLTDRHREKIRASMLINRLQGFVLGEKDPNTEQVIEMTPHQVSGALGLLKKVLPDLQSHKHGGDEEAPPISVVERVIVKAPDRDGSDL